MSENTVPLKQCSRKEKCVNPLGSWLPGTTEYFNLNHKAKDGFYSLCKECRKAYRERNKDHIFQQKKTWRENNPEKEKSRVKKWTEENRDRNLQTKRDYFQSHRDEMLAYFKIAHMRRKSERTPIELIAFWDKAKIHSRNWRLNNPISAKSSLENNRSKRKQADGKHTQQDLEIAYYEQNEQCFFCGIHIFWQLKRDIHVDHLMPLSRGGTNWPDNIVLSCESCNASKNSKTLNEWMEVRGW